MRSQSNGMYRGVLMACLSATLVAGSSCTSSEKSDDPIDTPAVGKPGHDLALYYLRQCVHADARLMARLGTEKLSTEAEKAALVGHFETLITLSNLSRAFRTGGPLVDGCIPDASRPPNRNPRRTQAWRDPEVAQTIADSLAALEAAGESFEPLVPPESDPRHTIEIAALLANLDQYERVEALLADLPDEGRPGWWKRYITTVMTARREINADWERHDACRDAVAALEALIRESEDDPTLSPLSVVAIWNIAMLQRHLGRDNEARRSIARAMTHPASAGKFRGFLHQSWGRL